VSSRKPWEPSEEKVWSGEGGSSTCVTCWCRSSKVKIKHAWYKWLKDSDIKNVTHAGHWWLTS
jgi:hypothetical protein